MARDLLLSRAAVQSMGRRIGVRCGAIVAAALVPALIGCWHGEFEWKPLSEVLAAGLIWIVTAWVMGGALAVGAANATRSSDTWWIALGFAVPLALASSVAFTVTSFAHGDKSHPIVLLDLATWLGVFGAIVLSIALAPLALGVGFWYAHSQSVRSTAAASILRQTERSRIETPERRAARKR